jgi:hypothetical protein
MRKLYVVCIIFALLCMMAPAMARTHEFTSSNGDSGYQGLVTMNDDGNIAFTIVAYVNGDATINDQQVTDDVGASQNVQADGQGVFAGSGAATTDGNYATTADMANGDASISTVQSVNADYISAGAEQDATAAGDQVLATSSAGNNWQSADSVSAAVGGAASLDVSGQEAEVNFFTGSEAGQESVTADGDNVYIESSADGFSSAEAVTSVNGAEGPVLVQDQSVEDNWFESEAGQGLVSANGNEVTIASFAEKAGDDASATTEVINGGATVTDQEAEVTFFGAEAEQGGVGAAGDVIVIASSVNGDSGASAVTTAIGLGSQAGVTGQEAEDNFFGASAEQDYAYGIGDVVVIQSSANGDSGAIAYTDVINGGAAVTGQEAEDNFFEASAEQDYVDASGDFITIGVGAEKDGLYAGALTSVVNGNADVQWQDAETEVFFGSPHEAEADQHVVSADGSAIYLETTAGFDYGSSAAATALIIDSVGVTSEQNAEWEYGASADQVTQTGPAGAISIDTSATNGGDSAGTHLDGTNVFESQASQNAEAALFSGASADQTSELTAGWNEEEGSGNAVTWSSSEDRNDASTWVKFEGTDGGLDANQVAVADGDAWATEGEWFINKYGELDSHTAVAVETGTAEAGSAATSREGDTATTVAGVDNGGMIQTVQGAAAGDTWTFGFHADGAAAGQESIIDATDGGYAVSTSSSEEQKGFFILDKEESNAGTQASISGDGWIVTFQGAAAGDVFSPPQIWGVKAEGAVAGQASWLSSDDGGTASSWSSTEDPTFATTEAGYHGDGYIYGTFQGAAAGEVKEFGEGSAEGSIAIQHTEEISSEVVDGDTVWASSYANNNGEYQAGTLTFALGDGLIQETTQGAIAGEGELWGPFETEVEGAAAGQYTEHIESCVECGLGGGGAITWSEGDPKCGEDSQASTKAVFFGDGGYIDNTLQVAGAGEVDSFFYQTEGANAFQHTDTINIEDGIAFTETESSIHSKVNSAETGNMVLGDGAIIDTTQAASAGEFENFFAEGKGAAAGQLTLSVGNEDSDGKGSAWSKANNEWDNKAGTVAKFEGDGVIYQTAQGAGAGEVESWFFEVEGAAAGQETTQVISKDGGLVKSWAENRDPSEVFTEAGYNGDGYINGITQTSAAGEVESGPFEIEGALAIQDVDKIYSKTSGWATSQAEFSERVRRVTEEATAYSTVEFGKRGSVNDLTQGAIAGEFDLDWLLEVDGEGAVAGQHFESVSKATDIETYASLSESDKCFTSIDTASVEVGGYPNDLTQIAGAGKLGFEDPFDVELTGAAAVQGMDLSLAKGESEASYHNGAATDSSDMYLIGTQWAAAGEVEDGFTVSGATAGWLPLINIF